MRTIARLSVIGVLFEEHHIFDSPLVSAFETKLSHTSCSNTVRRLLSRFFFHSYSFFLDKHFFFICVFQLVG